MAQKPNLKNIFFAEFIGSIILLMTIVGAGIMADQVSGDDGVSMFITVTCIAISLGLIIKLFRPISDGHFNPLVSISHLISKKIGAQRALIMIIAQFSGAIIGTLLANLMFDLPIISISKLDRLGNHIYFAEFISTVGLFIVLKIIDNNTNLDPSIIIPIFIAPAIFYTSSTAFVNPSVTIARTLSDTFTGISPASVPYFLIVQIIGAFIGVFISKGLFSHSK
ncbi:MAG: hypothetical protein RIS18_386 [Actinomycetota bacterium]